MPSTTSGSVSGLGLFHHDERLVADLLHHVVKHRAMVLSPFSDSRADRDDLLGGLYLFARRFDVPGARG